MSLSHLSLYQNWCLIRFITRLVRHADQNSVEALLRSEVLPQNGADYKNLATKCSEYENLRLSRKNTKLVCPV